MRNDEILEKIKKLSPTERISLIEAVLQLVKEDFQRLQPQSPGTNGTWPPIGTTRTSSPDYYTSEETSPSSSAFDDDDDITTLKKL
jgi:hypothetical protein